MFKAVLEDRVLSCLVGRIGLLLLWPMMLILALAIRLLSDQPVFQRFRMRDDPSRSVLLFRCDGPLGDFLRRYSLLVLPAILCLASGQLTMLEWLQLDWGG